MTHNFPDFVANINSLIQTVEFGSQIGVKGNSVHCSILKIQTQFTSSSVSFPVQSWSHPHSNFNLHINDSIGNPITLLMLPDRNCTYGSSFS
jgi:hypothetical protein